MCNKSAFAVVVLDAAGRCPGSALIQMVGLVCDGGTNTPFTLHFNGISLLDDYRMRFEADVIEKRIQGGASLIPNTALDLEDAFDQMADWFENIAKDMPIWAVDAASAHTIINGMALVSGNKSPVSRPLMDVSTLQFLTELPHPEKPTSLQDGTLQMYARDLSVYIRLASKCIPSFPGKSIPVIFDPHRVFNQHMAIREVGSLCG